MCNCQIRIIFHKLWKCYCGHEPMKATSLSTVNKSWYVTCMIEWSIIWQSLSLNIGESLWKHIYIDTGSRPCKQWAFLSSFYWLILIEGLQFLIISVSKINVLHLIQQIDIPWYMYALFYYLYNKHLLLTHEERPLIS